MLNGGVEVEHNASPSEDAGVLMPQRHCEYFESSSQVVLRGDIRHTRGEVIILFNQRFPISVPVQLIRISGFMDNHRYNGTSHDHVFAGKGGERDDERRVDHYVKHLAIQDNLHARLPLTVGQLRGIQPLLVVENVDEMGRGGRGSRGFLMMTLLFLLVSRCYSR